MDELSVIRGYKTPNMSELAKQGLSLNRMYTEPSCTPTRVAMLTGPVTPWRANIMSTRSIYIYKCHRKLTVLSEYQRGTL